LQTTYRDVNDCHAAEKLREVEGLPISRASVQRLRRALGLPAKHRRRPREYRARRTPEARMGALVQLDVSPFAWLEGRGAAMTLHGAIDDATATVLALVFRPTEDLHGYATLPHQLGTGYGLPLALYGDRLNVFVRNDRYWTLEEELQGAQHPTHFGQMLRALGIGFIAAGSPRRRVASNASGAPCRIASPWSCGCPASAPSPTPTRSCLPSSPISTATSPVPPRTPPRPGAPCRATWPPSSAAATLASSPATTPSASDRG
jgi:hypothetical protein